MYKKIATYFALFLFGMMGFFGDLNIQVLGNDGGSSYIIQVKTTFADDCTVGVDPGCTNPLSGPQNAAQQTTQNAKMQDMLQNLVAGLNITLEALTIIVSPAIMLASWLMSPDWTSGDLFQIRPIIHSLWVTVSNVTYFIYAILLIFIALATIFNSENYGYKQLLPKLALGILMVPMTWWFVQFTISVASYVTASVLTLPAEVMKNYSATNGSVNTWWEAEMIPANISYDSTKQGSKINKIDCGIKGVWAPGECISIKDMVSKGGGIYSPLLVYGYGIFNFQAVFDINGVVDLTKIILKIIHQGIVGAIMFFIFGLLVLALIFMLLIRAVKLWFYAIFSPFMTLKFVLGDKFFGKEGSDAFDLKEFIGLAFVPALVGLALSFGLIIIAAMKMAGGNDGTAGGNQGKCLDTPTGCKITIMGNSNNTIVTKINKTDNPNDPYTETVVDFAGVKYSYKGSVTGASGDMAEGAQSIISSAGGIFGTIIIDIIALIFIWVAFMAAKGVSKVAATAFEPFEQIGKKVGTLATSLPKYAPILPSSLGGSVGGLSKGISNIDNNLSAKSQKDFEDTTLGRMTNAKDNIPTDMLKKITDAINKGDPESKQVLKDNLANMSRANAYRDIPQPIADKIRSYGSDDSGLRKYFTNLGIDNVEAQNKLKTFAIEKGEKLTDANKKEFLSLFTSALGGSTGTGTGGTGANNTSGGFTGKLDGANITMNFNGQPISVTKGKTNTETEASITSGIISRIAELENKGIKIDAKILADMIAPGINGGTVEANKIAENIIKNPKFDKIRKTAS